MDKRSAYNKAMEIANKQAAPCLIMYDGKDYRVGLRTDNKVRYFGKHVATAKRYGIVAENDCLIPLGDYDRRCLCQ